MQRDEVDDLPDEMVERLIQLDAARLHDTVANEADDATSDDDLSDVAQCLDMIERVRAHDPFCIADLESEIPIASWARGETEQPSHIGRFRILKRLGDGGFGVVFLAWDPRLEREVAMKLPRVETLVSTKSRDRFLRELRTGGRFNHPNIGTVFEAGALGPILYIVSQYYSGGSVEELLSQRGDGRPLSPEQAAHLVAAIAEGVQHAHDQGILHRDIKPSNILLDSPPGESDIFDKDPQELGRRARLVDFGIAKDMFSLATPTRSGIILGTPAYTAPELLNPRTEATDVSDVYSLGATLFHLITGNPPLKRETNFETLVANQRDEPPAPSRMIPGIPRDMDAICLKCLEKEPERRYATATDLANDLYAFLAGTQVRARRTTRVEKAVRWCRKNSLLATLIVATSVLFTAVAGSLLYAAHLIREQNEISENLLLRLQYYEESARSDRNREAPTEP